MSLVSINFHEPGSSAYPESARVIQFGGCGCDSAVDRGKPAIRKYVNYETGRKPESPFSAGKNSIHFFAGEDLEWESTR